MEFILCLVGYFMQWVGVLMAIAFYTLLERKVLGGSQVRKGPNKVGYLGILQPFADAMKLFSKESKMPLKSSGFMYMLSPMMTLLIPLVLWVVQPYWFVGVQFLSGWMFMFMGLSLGVYSMFLSGWSSNSKYAMMGSLRGVAQMMSYEVVMALVIIVFIIMMGSYQLGGDNKAFLVSVLLLPVVGMWILMMMGESQRSPFDLAEGESELVSGFNIEYGSVGFALLFMGEYGSMLLMSMLSYQLLWGGQVSGFSFPIMLWVVSFLYLWLRATFPRVRYDQLMYLAWKTILPITMYSSGGVLLVYYVLT